MKLSDLPDIRNCYKSIVNSHIRVQRDRQTMSLLTQNRDPSKIWTERIKLLL